MSNVPNTTAADAKAKLKAEFPDWSIIQTTDTGRWWATRGPMVSESMNRPADVSADTPEGLRERIREATRGE